MKQRRTQTQEFWQNEFSLNTNNVEFISNRILEESQVLTIDQIAITLVQQHCETEEQEMLALQDGRIYQPNESYVVDEKVIFPQLNFRIGTVQSVREGRYPDYNDFSVIGVTFTEHGPTREFVAEFTEPDILNLDGDSNSTDLQGLRSPEEVYQAFRQHIRSRIKVSLDGHPEFIRFQDNYYLKDLLPEFQDGLFNIADAAIDINQGPLAVDKLIQEMGLAPDGQITETTRFLVNCQLAKDERFDDVGPTGEVLWYLSRLEPPEIFSMPERLEAVNLPYDATTLDDEMVEILADIDDELTHPDDLQATPADAQTLTISLIYAHLRAGTLPLTIKTRPFFPVSQFNPVLIDFVDGRTGKRFPGWVVSNKNYVWGLKEWYTKNSLPVGTYISLKRTDNPREIVIDFEAIRGQRDWVRQASIEGNKLLVRMNTEAIACKYDELMMLSEDNREKIDLLWLKHRDSKSSVAEALINVFPELSKLSPQSTVHIKNLYTAVNMLRRIGPGPIMQALIDEPYFIDMEHGYWSYNPKLRG